MLYKQKRNVRFGLLWSAFAALSLAASPIAMPSALAVAEVPSAEALHEAEARVEESKREEERISSDIDYAKKTLAEKQAEFSKSVSADYKSLLSNSSNKNIETVVASGSNVFSEIHKTLSYSEAVSDKQSDILYELKQAEADLQTALVAQQEITNDSRASLDSIVEARKSLLTNISDERVAETHYCQWYGPWADSYYWGGTMSGYGCGLCAYTSIVNLLTGSDYSPMEVNSLRGKNWNGMDASTSDKTGSYPLTHAEVTKEQFGLDMYRVTPDVDVLRDELSDGDAAAMVLSRGTVFHNENGNYRYSAGHFICVYKATDDGFYVQDSSYKTPGIFYSDYEMGKMLNASASALVIYKMP